MNVKHRLRAITGPGVAGVLLVLSTAAVFAQPSTPLPPAAEQALRRGLVAAQQEAWPLAIRYFSEAHKAAPGAPTVLFNLALAHSRAGNEILGIMWLRAYRAAAPQAPNGAQVREEIERLEVVAEAKVGQLIGQALAALDQVPQTHRSLAVLAIAEVQAKAGDIAGARQTAEDATDPHLGKNVVLSAIAQVQAKAGDFAGARQTAAEIADPIWNDLTLYLIVKAQAEAGDLAGARRTAEKATGVSSSYSMARAQALLAIAEAQLTAGGPAGAGRTEIAEQIQKAPEAKLKAAEIEMGRWVDLARRFAENDSIINLDGRLRKIKGKDPAQIPKELADTAAILVDALHNIRKVEREMHELQEVERRGAQTKP